VGTTCWLVVIRLSDRREKGISGRRASVPGNNIDRYKYQKKACLFYYERKR
jgi:hypothetical protein